MMEQEDIIILYPGDNSKYLAEFVYCAIWRA